MPEKTLFSRIIDGDIPADKVYEDEGYCAFRDIHPAAPEHVLVVPKKVIPTLAVSAPEDQEVLGGLLLAAKNVAEVLGIDKTGYRCVINTGRDSAEVPFTQILGAPDGLAPRMIPVPGQPCFMNATVQEMKYLALDAQTRLCAVIGNPVGHSLSPAMHNAAFEASGLNYVYLAFAVSDLAGCMAGMRALHGFRGMSVTIPHKIAIMEYLDEVAPLAQPSAA